MRAYAAYVTAPVFSIRLSRNQSFTFETSTGEVVLNNSDASLIYEINGTNLTRSFLPVHISMITSGQLSNCPTLP